MNVPDMIMRHEADNAIGGLIDMTLGRLLRAESGFLPG